MSITLNRVEKKKKNVVACTYAGKSRIITRGAHPIGKKDIDDIDNDKKRAYPPYKFEIDMIKNKK